MKILLLNEMNFDNLMFEICSPILTLTPFHVDDGCWSLGTIMMMRRLIRSVNGMVVIIFRQDVSGA